MWLFLFVCILLFLVWNSKTDIKDLRADLKDLESEVERLRCQVEGTPATAEKTKPAPAYHAPDFIEEDDYPLPHQTETVPASYRASSIQSETISHDYQPSQEFHEKKQGNGFEFNLGAKLPVWIGAIALVFAGFYLVKYSIESGWLQPAIRLTLGALMGGGLLGAGQWLIHRPNIANSMRMAQGLVGAGLVTLYVCLYAAVNLYDLIGPTIGFCGMVGVTTAAVIMSLRHGQPIAIFGLVGGLITPALVASDEPNAFILFTYLFLMFAGVIFLFSRKGWWALASVTILGMFAWSALWFVSQFSSDDALVLVLYALGLCGVVLVATAGVVRRNGGDLTLADQTAVRSLNILAVSGGVATIIWLSILTDLSLFDWSMLGLLTLASYGLAFFMPQSYKHLVFIKMGADLILFGLWSASDASSLYMLIAVGLFAVYALVPMLLMRWVSDPRMWAGLQLVSALAVFLIAYLRLPMFKDYQIPFEEFWGCVALIAASYSVFLAHYIRQKYLADDAIRDYLLAVYALSATAFLSLGVAIEVPWAHMPAAFALQALATMWIYSQTNIPFLRHIMVGLAAIFLLLNWQQIALLASIVGASILGDVPHHRDLQGFVLDNPLTRLGIPAFLWMLTLYVHVRSKDREPFLTGLLFGTVLFLASLLSYYMLKLALHSGPEYISQESTFLQRGGITMFIAFAGIAMFHASEKYELSSFMRQWGVLFFKLAICRVIYFDLIIMNPYFSDNQHVGEWPLINGITMVYGGALLLCLWAIYKADWHVGQMAAQKFYKILGFILLFVFTSLSVRQLFNGANIAGDGIGSTEFYAYSIAWLLTGLALLTYGIMRDSRTARMASLAFMLLTIGKVFFFDASELEGLYRVFSFLGLGVSLIGLSYFYSKFVFRKPA